MTDTTDARSIETVLAARDGVEVVRVDCPPFGPKWLRRTTASGHPSQAETLSPDVADHWVAELERGGAR